MAMPYVYDEEEPTPNQGAGPTQPQEEPFQGLVDVANSGLSGIEQGVINAIAQHSNRQVILGNFVKGAKQGKNTIQQLQDQALYMRSQNQKDEEEKARVDLERSQLEIGQADTGAYDQAAMQYDQGMNGGPTAPQQVDPKVTDLEKIIGALALATGTPAHLIVKSLDHAAKTRANTQNQKAQKEFDVLDKNHRDNMARLRFRMETEGDKVNRQDTLNVRKFSAKDRQLAGQRDDIQNAIDTRTKMIAAGAVQAEKIYKGDLKTAERLVKEQFNSKTGWNQWSEAWLKKEALTIAMTHHPEDATDDEIKQFASDVYDHLSQYKIGEQSRMQVNADRTATETNRRNTETEKISGRNATTAEGRLKESERHNQEVEKTGAARSSTSAARENRLGSGGGSSGSAATPKPAKPPTPKEKATAQTRIAELQAEIADFPEDENTWTKAQQTASDELETLELWVNPAKENELSIIDPSKMFGGIKDILNKSGVSDRKPTPKKKPVAKAPAKPPAKPKPNAPVVGKGKGKKVVGKYEIKG